MQAFCWKWRGLRPRPLVHDGAGSVEMEMVMHTLYDGGIQKQEEEERKASLLLCISGSLLVCS